MQRTLTFKPSLQIIFIPYDFFGHYTFSSLSNHFLHNRMQAAFHSIFCNRILLRIKNAYTALTVGTMVTVSENVELRNMGSSDARVAIA